MSVRVVLGLGSNRQFDNFVPLQLLECACIDLQTVLEDISFSSVYRTKAMYVTDQDDFYNMAVTGFYGGTAEELLKDCHVIENKFGRDRTKEFRNGPRPLDIDIELFGEERLSTADLVIPHERLCERAFVLEPMLEILSACADVERNRLDYYRHACSSLGEQGIVKVLGSKEFTEAVHGRNVG